MHYYKLVLTKRQKDCYSDTEQRRSYDSRHDWRLG